MVLFAFPRPPLNLHFVIPLTWTEGNKEEQPNQDNEEDSPAHVDSLTNWGEDHQDYSFILIEHYLPTEIDTSAFLSGYWDSVSILNWLKSQK